MSCNGNHVWARTHSLRTSTSKGERTIWACNNCLAVKVRFERWVGSQYLPDVEKVCDPEDTRSSSAWGLVTP